MWLGWWLLLARPRPRAAATQAPAAAPAATQAPAAAAPAAPAAKDAGKGSIAVVLTGPWQDHSWNEAGYEAVQALGKKGAKIAFSENVKDADAARVLREYCDQGYEMIVAHSFSFQDAAFQVAKECPKSNFAWGGGIKRMEKNVADYDQPFYEAAYPIGVLAGHMSKTGVLGALYGFDIPVCHAMGEALLAGAKTVNPNAKLITTAVGDWVDVAKAKEAALAQNDAGVDFWIECGEGPALGAIEAAKDKGGYVTGYVGDMTSNGPNSRAGQPGLEPGAAVHQDAGRDAQRHIRQALVPLRHCRRRHATEVQRGAQEQDPARGAESGRAGHGRHQVRQGQGRLRARSQEVGCAGQRPEVRGRASLRLSAADPASDSDAAPPALASFSIREAFQVSGASVPVTETAAPAVVEMRGIVKRFPGVIANAGVDFDLLPGEVHALLGENGAGKSTLMNVLYGLYPPDAGEVRLFGERVAFNSAADAIAHGLGMVHQHFMLVKPFTVAENIVLGQPSPRAPLLEERRARSTNVWRRSPTSMGWPSIPPPKSGRCRWASSSVSKS